MWSSSHFLLSRHQPSLPDSDAALKLKQLIANNPIPGDINFSNSTHLEYTYLLYTTQNTHIAPQPLAIHFFASKLTKETTTQINHTRQLSQQLLRDAQTISDLCQQTQCLQYLEQKFRKIEEFDLAKQALQCIKPHTHWFPCQCKAFPQDVIRTFTNSST